MASFLQGEFSREWTGVFGSYMQSKYSSFFLLLLISVFLSHFCDTTLKLLAGSHASC